MSPPRVRCAVSVTLVAALALAAGCAAQDPYALRTDHHRVAAVKANALNDYDRAAREQEKAFRAYARGAVRDLDAGRPAPLPPPTVPSVM